MKKAALVLLWALAAAAVMLIITLPINLQAHLIIGILVVATMIILKMMKPEGNFRLIALALGTAIVLRYVYWRTTSTLPPLNEPANFIPGFMLYCGEMYSVFMLFVSLFVVSSPLPKRVAPPIDPENIPFVDIFVPTYNEDAELLTMTLAAAKAMDYPTDKFKVWLLDDGGSDQKCNSPDVATAVAAQERRAELTALAEELGVTYLTRARNEHAKAGNLNNGLNHSHGSIVVVFDADHSPARSFLQETIGYFAQDPKLFLVQTPHFFINPDPLERNLQTFEFMPSENEMFYGLIQRGLDKWDASFFCGSAALLRREALEQTNGFSGISITEDCETALELHSSGWHSLYVDKPLIAGLQPDTFASFIGQRTRWAQGMMQILRFRFPPGKRGLNLWQRLCYMSSTLFWLFPLPRLMFLIAPLFYLFFSLEIFTASGAEFMAYTFSYMIVNLLMQNYLYGRFRWPWVSELYEFIQSVYLFPALLSVVANPRKPTFNVTAKGESLAEDRISEIGKPFYIIFAVLLVGVAATVWRIIEQPYKADVTIVVGAWNILNLIMAGCSLGVVSERSTRRLSHRVDVQRRCSFHFGEQTIPAMVENVSIGGARVRAVGHLQNVVKGAAASITFEPLSSLEVKTLPMVIRNTFNEEGGLILGCQFMPTTPQHRQLIADLVFANADQWTKIQEARRTNVGVLRGTWWFLTTSIYQTGRGLSYLFRRPKPAQSPALSAATAGK
ncbi:cellulose synthase (UDP-forming) [Faunimonas pinastri]|uniref:Cellulose synthase catalytic subunit [UDP-forming] n=1 Tax=Faunimonas pinastri TaxID=1855383 RepID=A0A1H9NI49_9HYPH|nr:UDP-forming cellulose synthase catalytic subunit [Faunimonas pinastri]SER35581.1 cellulose synthase (UDP-forming) [Faunimonas pinastri]